MLGLELVEQVEAAPAGQVLRRGVGQRARRGAGPRQGQARDTQPGGGEGQAEGVASIHAHAWVSLNALPMIYNRGPSAWLRKRALRAAPSRTCGGIFASFSL